MPWPKGWQQHSCLESDPKAEIVKQFGWAVPRVGLLMSPNFWKTMLFGFSYFCAQGKQPKRGNLSSKANDTVLSCAVQQQPPVFAGNIGATACEQE